jgi:serine O-acetyltransferase
MLTGAQISARATIGKGLFICHPHGIVIGATAVIGKHCTLIHGNVLGQMYAEGDRPIIGDYFIASTGAKILGRVRIGDHVRVGPNAVVTRSIPDGAIVAAVPSRIIPGTGTRAPGAAENPSPVGKTSAASSAANREMILTRVESVLASLNDGQGQARDAVTEATPLFNSGVGLSSIELLSFICGLEEEFGLTIDEDEVHPAQLETVGSLVTFIGERMSK